MSEVLRRLPQISHPDLLVGLDSSDDAGVVRLSDGQALVQTVDFFTPIVDDPYWYGAIAAANSLSDVYAMGGRPITVLNIACFDPTMAPPEVWAEVLRGAFEKTAESGAIVVGGHSVEDSAPKFGLSVTGLVDPSKMFVNTNAKPGDDIYLSKPLGTGIVTTAIKYDKASPEEANAAIQSMAALNKDASEKAQAAGVRCATDITGFGLAGHLFNVARASNVQIEIDSKALPILPGVERVVGEEMLTGGARKNEQFLEGTLTFAESVPKWLRELILDPQTSGGLAVFSKKPIADYPRIGKVTSSGKPAINVV